MIHKQYRPQVWRASSGLALGITIVMQVAIGVTCAQLSVAVSSDMSKPTYGLHGPTSSQLILNDHTGLHVQGALKDLLGPPIKMAQGFNTVLNGSHMAGLGQSLKSGGAVLGVDAKLLEAAGGAHLFKGGLLLGGAATKMAEAKKVPGGKKIASVVELPVKVIAMKNLAEGKTLTELGKMKGMEAAQSEMKGDKLIQQGNLLKSQGMSQVLQGAQEGIQNIGQAVQQTTGDAATALKLLPIIFDMHSTAPAQQHPEQQAEVKGTQQSDQSHHMRQSAGGPLTGGSMFGGLGSLMPGLTAGGSGSGGDPFLNALIGGGGQHRPSPFGQLFGSGLGGGQQNHYAAVLNATNPLTELLLNPNMNPFLLPLNGAMDPMANPMAAPLTQAFSHPQRHPTTQSGGIGSLGSGFGFGFGGHSVNQGGSQTSTFNLFPGLKYRETVSTNKMDPNHHQQQQQLQEKTSQQSVEQQPLPVKTPTQQQESQQQQQQQQQQDESKKI